MSLNFRVLKTGQTTCPYQLERLDEKGCVTSVRPASAEEYLLFRVALRQVP